MTRSHAKNNTTQSTLSYYERSLLRKEGAARRVGQDSFKPLDACNLCLSRVDDPVACSQGHLYCRLCCISDLVAQKAGIEAKKREMDRWEESERAEREDAKVKARERVVADFEKGMGLGGPTAKRIAIGENKPERDASAKFELDSSVVDKVAAEAEEKAMKVIEAEQAESRKAKLAAFWLPSLTPEAKLGPLKDVKLQTLCHIGSSPHPISRKTLLPVIFTYPPASTAKPICPTCSRELSNAASPILLSSKSPASDDAADGGRKSKKQKKEDPFVCGHVVCLTCSDTIVKPQGRCCVCDAKVDDAGRIPLGKEGTGFAAAGGAEAKKSTIAFRV
ncbi:hypothetical protein IAU60_003278 [Kwoniella sp. DSM 27419]